MEIKTEKKTSLQKLTKSLNMIAEIIAFLNGNIVLHKMAVCNKHFRKAAQILGPLNKDRVIIYYENWKEDNFELDDGASMLLFHFTNKIVIKPEVSSLLESYKSSKEWFEAQLILELNKERKEKALSKFYEKYQYLNGEQNQSKSFDQAINLQKDRKIFVLKEGSGHFEESYSIKISKLVQEIRKREESSLGKFIKECGLVQAGGFSNLVEFIKKDSNDRCISYSDKLVEYTLEILKKGQYKQVRIFIPIFSQFQDKKVRSLFDLLKDELVANNIENFLEIRIIDDYLEGQKFYKQLKQRKNQMSRKLFHLSQYRSQKSKVSAIYLHPKNTDKQAMIKEIRIIFGDKSIYM